MATIIKLEQKRGVKYRIQVKVRNVGSGKQETKVDYYEPPIGLSEREVQRELQRYAMDFEDKCRDFEKMQNDIDGNLTVKEYSELFLESTLQNCSLSYYSSCRKSVKEINEHLGGYRLKDLNPSIIERFRDYLKTKEFTTSTAVPKVRFSELMAERKLTCAKLGGLAGVSDATVKYAREGKNISPESAKKISSALGLKVNTLFDIKTKTQPYQAESIAKAFRTLKAMLSSAKRLMVIPENYAKAEYVKGIPQEHRPIQCLDLKSSTDLIACLKGEDIRIKTALMIILLTGIRRGECAGLEWSALDLEEGTMDITRSSTVVSGFGVVTKDPKTKNSKRCLELPPSLVTQLKEYKVWWDNYVESLGDRYNGIQSLFLQKSGQKALYPATILYWLKKILEKYNLPPSHIHGLRHTNISVQLSSNLIPEKEVSARAGHGSTKVTKDIYWELFKDDSKRAAMSIDFLFGLGTQGADNLC